MARAASYVFELTAAPAAVAHKEAQHTVERVAGVYIIDYGAEVASYKKARCIFAGVADDVAAECMDKEQPVLTQRASAVHRSVELRRYAVEYVGEHIGGAVIHHHSHGSFLRAIVDQRQNSVVEIRFAQEGFCHQ